MTIKQNPTDADNNSRTHLPHYDQAGLIQMVTFRLNDSMPVLHRSEWDELRKLSPALVDHKMQTYLDAGNGSCILSNPEVTKVTEECLLHFDQVRYLLLAWVVMPNHVHVLVKTQQDWPLACVVQGWKSVSARMIGVLAYAKTVWHKDYYDRYIRNESHLLDATRYIHSNPVVEGLVRRCEDWLHSSARLVATPESMYHNPWEVGI
jgi:putative transposase